MLFVILVCLSLTLLFSCVFILIIIFKQCVVIVSFIGAIDHIQLLQESEDVHHITLGRIFHLGEVASNFEAFNSKSEVIFDFETLCQLVCILNYVHTHSAEHLLKHVARLPDYLFEFDIVAFGGLFRLPFYLLDFELK